MHHSNLSLLLLTASLAAQTQTLVSPLVAATAEGTSNNVYPFSHITPRRYQQIHSDLGSTPKMIKMLSFRMNAANGNSTGTGTCDTELFLGHSVDWDKVGFTYASNYLTPPQNVVARKVLTWGPQGVNSLPGPCQFVNMDIPLDAPFLYLGSMSLAWEAAVYSTTIGTGYLGTMDAEVASTVRASSTTTGLGCTAIGRTAAMTHSFLAVDMAGTLLLGWTVTNGPTTAPTVLSIGTVNPSLVVPGLCSSLLTDMAASISLGLTDATGAITDAMSPALVIPNTLPGVTIYSQAHSLDPLRAEPIPVSNSNGLSTPMPVPSYARTTKTSRIWNDAGGPTATRGRVTLNSVGYGLVTQFTF